MNTANTLISGLLISVSIFFSASPTSAQTENVLTQSDNAFAFDLFGKIASSQPGKNIFISPISVSGALQMVINGATGDTRAELARALHVGELDAATVNAAGKNLQESLNAETNAVLNLANGIWYQKGFSLKPEFVATDKTFFGAGLEPVDFQSPASAQVINAWADEKTHGKVKDVVSFPFPPQTKVVLANAIYFKGKWAEPFDKGRTEKGVFHPGSGAARDVMMMSQQREFDYLETDQFQAVRLPYAGGRLNMCLFLPATNSGPAPLAAGFAGSGWQDTASKFRERRGLLEFPRFKMDYEVTLNEPLQALGIKRAFDPGAANFSAMAAEPLFIGLAKQKSFVAVDEEGTEAAAVTTISMRASGIPMHQPPPFRMIVDRPFFFVITDTKTQAILFMGIISDPAS